MGRWFDSARQKRRQADYSALTEPHLDALFRTALRLVGTVEPAEDLVQETCLKAYRAFDGFQEGTNYRAWLFRIMRNLFIDTHHRRGEPTVVDLDLVRNEARARSVTDGSGRHSPEVLYLHRSFRRDLLRALGGLAPETRLVAVLILVEGFSYDEAAAIAGCPLGTVRSRLSRGRKLLQAQLTDYLDADGFDGDKRAGLCDEAG